MLHLTSVENSSFDEGQAAFRHFKVVICLPVCDLKEFFIALAFSGDTLLPLATGDAAHAIDFQRKFQLLIPMLLFLRKEDKRLAAIAAAVGIHAIRVDQVQDVRSAIANALAHKGPALVDVVTTPYELSLPPKTSIAQAWGFSLFLLKEVLLGHSKDVIEEIRTNR